MYTEKSPSYFYPFSCLSIYNPMKKAHVMFVCCNHYHCFPGITSFMHDLYSKASFIIILKHSLIRYNFSVIQIILCDSHVYIIIYENLWYLQILFLQCSILNLVEQVLQLDPFSLVLVLKMHFLESLPAQRKLYHLWFKLKYSFSLL